MMIATARESWGKGAAGQLPLTTSAASQGKQVALASFSNVQPEMCV